MAGVLVVGGALLAVPGGSAHAADLDPCTAPTPFPGTARVYASSCDVKTLLTLITRNRANFLNAAVLQ